MKTQKRLIAVHDISCVGKCSLTVALPVISAAGIECSVLPTAVLSTHTGGFTGFTYRDLTDDIEPISKHWQSLDLKIDAFYTGFLGSERQLSLIGRLFADFDSKDCKIIVDPVMADNVKRYSVFPPSFAKGMRELCTHADLIVPNITEASFLLDIPYKEGPYSKNYIEDMLVKLSDIGPSQVVLTGVYFDTDTLGAAVFDKSSGSIEYVLDEKIDGYYHGTGDLFASALSGAVLNGISLEDSARIAVDFTVSSIRRTHDAATDVKYGVNFESGIADYALAVRNK